MIESRRHQHNAMAEPDALGTLGAGREKDFWRRGMRIFLEEVVLHLPSKSDTKAVSQLHLVERLLKQFEFGTFGPWAGQLMLVEDPELHGRLTPPVSPAHISPDCMFLKLAHAI